MIQIYPETGDKIFYNEIQYVEMTPDEIKTLPFEVIINVATVDRNTGCITGINEYVTGERFSRPVLYKMPFRDSFINIGRFKNRKYLYRCK